MKSEELKKRLKELEYKKVLIYLVLIFFAIFYLMPLYTGINVSLKPQSELAQTAVTPVKNPTIQTYMDAFERIKGPLWNNISFTVPAVLISTFLGAMSGYIFSKFRFKYDTIIFFVVVMGFYVPPQSIIIPLMKTLTYFGIFDTIWGLIFIHVSLGMPITTMLWRDYYTSIPDEIVESAIIDGNGIASVFKKIIIPLSVPGFIVVGLFQFVNIWNEYFIAISVTATEAQPLSKAVVNLAGSTVAQWNVQSAGAMMMLLPCVLIFALIQRRLVRGLMAGAVKR
ncbi:MAG: carbohydrate ABC transporter permease [Candidatus Hadarchaeia archaeon]